MPVDGIEASTWKYKAVLDQMIKQEIARVMPRFAQSGEPVIKGNEDAYPKSFLTDTVNFRERRMERMHGVFSRKEGILPNHSVSAAGRNFGLGRTTSYSVDPDQVKNGSRIASRLLIATRQSIRSYLGSSIGKCL